MHFVPLVALYRRLWRIDNGVSYFINVQKLVGFEDAIGVIFAHIRLLAKAFTHRNVGYNLLTMWVFQFLLWERGEICLFAGIMLTEHFTLCVFLFMGTISWKELIISKCFMFVFNKFCCLSCCKLCKCITTLPSVNIICTNIEILWNVDTTDLRKAKVTISKKPLSIWHCNEGYNGAMGCFTDQGTQSKVGVPGGHSTAVDCLWVLISPFSWTPWRAPLCT